MLVVDIRKQLGDFELDVSFEAGDERLALLGASGCGKSMTLKCIAGIEKPDEGKIVLDDRVLFDSEKKINLSPQKRRVGYLFQQYALFPNMNVYQNVAAGCREKDKDKKKEKVNEMISRMRLTGLEKNKPSQLSGGQQQRTALARILINEPELLLLDEPFSALDSYLKWQMELELSDTLTDFGGTSLLVSHSREEVYRLCDNVCVLKDGRSEPKRAVKAMFAAPETYSSALLSGCKNFSHMKYVGKDRVYASDWCTELALPENSIEDGDMIGVRSHYIELSKECTGENCFKCRVERVVEDIFSSVVMFKTGGEGEHSTIRAELDKEVWSNFKDENEIWITMRPEYIMVLRS